MMVRSGEGQRSLGYLFAGPEDPNRLIHLLILLLRSQFRNYARDSNNYYRGDGQNTDNFIYDRPSTKVHVAPGGGSSLGYLFGEGGGRK
ncbi:hypothetical protein MKW94_004716 [Papaver nudicaule]|uniref:Uncharacterized protein n=1 Tax=Papaver nudicaule TaxID=74823 RepID=A0AA41VEC8_PAPNU|nr:hypothetical protein [Papaver nudicaule]